MTTLILFAVVLGLCAVSFLLWTLFLRIGLRWAEVEGITTRRVVIAAVAVYLSKFALWGAFKWLAPASEKHDGLLVTATFLTLTVLIPCLIISKVFNTQFGQSFKSWLPTLASSMILVILLALSRSLLIEAFASPSSPMAPTIRGEHVQDLCPTCGEPCFGPADILETNSHDPHGREMICENFHIEPHEELNGPVQSADHFVIAKYLEPNRWDIVVFRPPFDPEQLWVMRLVGLPGEVIVIEDGMVTADGEKLSPPRDLSGITYAATLSDRTLAATPLWGSADRPARLADREYFVLGDFTTRSRDPRLWPESDSDHPAFALPAANVVGVVTHIHWPPSRWRIVR
jgi:signal peptidase I